MQALYRAIGWGCLALMVSGCHPIPLGGSIRTDSKFHGDVQAAVEVRLPAVTDPGPLVATVVRPGSSPRCATRIAIVDVEGLLLNQNFTGLYSLGENPVATFREKLEVAARDPAVRAVVIRINSPGGGVTATDIMAEELRRFRSTTNKPTVACLMDLATAGAYYLAVGCDAIVAHPTTITGGVGALMNHYNLQDAMAQLNVTADPIKSGELVDMGSITTLLTPESKRLLQEMTDSFRDRFASRVASRRPGMSVGDRRAVADGRVVPAQRALQLHLVDRLGYLDDALDDAQLLAGIPGSEVVQYQRPGVPPRSIYASAPNQPLQGDFLPFSYPGLERTRLPTFLYLWQPDPTLTRLGGR